MNAPLEFPPIVDEALAVQEQTTAVAVVEPTPQQDLATMDLKTIALSGFYPHSRQADEAKAALTGLALDLSNQARIDEAKSLRWRLIGQPMADVRKLTKAMKSTLASASKAIGAEEERVLAEFGKADALITPQIQAREDELEAEREARAQAEADRKAKHEAGIARIQSFVRVAREKRLSSAAITGGITVLDGMQFGEDWEEYRQLAINARDETRSALQRLRDEAIVREEQEAENERLRQLAEEQAAEIERLRAAERERLAREHAELEAERIANLTAGAPKVQDAEIVLAEQPISSTITTPPASGGGQVDGCSGPVSQDQTSLPASPVTRSFRKHVQEKPAPSLRTATEAELRSEWLLFAAALEHVRPSIQKHAAQVDALRFERAVDRLHQAFITTIEEINAC